MAKASRSNRRRKARKEQRKEKAAQRGEGEALKVRNQLVLGMILHCKGGRFRDRKKERDRRLCRDRIDI